MVAQITRPQRFAPPTREMSFFDLEEKIVKPLKTRTLSPSSVRCFPDDETKQSLVSSIGLPDSLPSSAETDSSTRRKVSFAPWVGVKDTITRYDMTDEEHENYWLQDEEYTRLRRRNRELIRRADTQSLARPISSSESELFSEFEDDIEKKEDGDYLCMRGLESGAKSESIRKKTYRRESIQRVLDEQEFQCIQGFRDAEAISEVYTEVASPCKFRAVHLAMEDRIAARR